MNEKNNENETAIYEVGYHIVPTTEESEVLVQVSKIRSIIEENGGTLVSEEMPKLINLAYEISKSVNAKKQKFGKAYFGWVKFEMNPDQVLVVKSKIENLPEILRFIIIKTVRENTIHTPKIPMFKKENKGESPVRGEVSAQNEPKEKVEISEEEIDKSIDELLIDEKIEN